MWSIEQGECKSGNVTMGLKRLGGWLCLDLSSEKI